MTRALLSSAYFAPIQWWQKLYRYDEVKIEAYDSFLKQTYRNRCVISSTNGTQQLTIPVEKKLADEKRDSKFLMKDVRISEHGNWRHIHWNAIKSSYGESPFFMFYADDIQPFFEKKWTFLYDFNLEICSKICELLGIQPNFKPTKEFIPLEDNRLKGVADFREVIHPKHPKEDKDFISKRYYQVYETKYGFIPNLSILDLLFNMGNESVLYL